MIGNEQFVWLPTLTLREPHPLAGREAWQCQHCQGIFYPECEPTVCPYCEPEEEADE